MIRIDSNAAPGTLLHVIIRRQDLLGPRANVSTPSEPLQVACMQIGQYQSFAAHLHRPRESTIHLTQEAWVVIAGEVEVTYYDFDKAELAKHTLFAGDCSVTYRGGHGYRCLSDKALVFEFKNGPYLGSADLDKEMI